MVRIRPIFLLCLATACGDNTDRPDAAARPDVAVDAVPCIPVANRPMPESVMTGELVFTPTDREITLPVTTVPLDRTILFTSLREAEISPQHGDVLCELSDPGTGVAITCYHQAMGTDYAGSTGEIRVRWTLVTFAVGGGVAVQRGTVDTAAGTNPATVTLSLPVDPAKSFVLLGGTRASGTGWSGNEFARAALTSGTTLDVRHGIAGSLVAWQVVQMLGAITQRGSATLGTTEVTKEVALTPVSAGSIALASYNTDNGGGFISGALMLEAVLQDSDTLVLKRGQPGTTLDVSWEVVTLPFTVVPNTTTFAAGETMKAVNVPNLPAATSVAIASNQSILGQASGSTDYAGTDIDLVGEAAVTLTTSVNTVTLQRVPSNAAASITWNAIDFSKDRCFEGM